MKKSTTIAVCVFAALVLALSFLIAACDSSSSIEAHYLITFHSNNGEGKTEQRAVTRSELTSYCPFENEGHHFTAWSESALGAAIDKDTKLENGMDLYALWEINVYEVRFCMTPENGQATDLVPAQKIEHGGYADIPSLYDFWQKVQGYRFEGFAEEANEPILKDSVFNAKLSEATSTAKFFLQDRLYFAVGGNAGDIIPAPPSTESSPRTGFLFAGWKRRSQTQNEMFEEGVTALGYGKTEYEADWTVATPAPPEINASNGDASEISVRLFQSLNVTATLPAPPSGLKYTLYWYEGAFEELPNGAVKVGDDELLEFSADRIVEGGYYFTAVLTAIDTKHPDSLARSYRTIHINVVKIPCSVTLMFNGSSEKDWTGDAVEFTIATQISPMSYTGEREFEFYLDGELLEEDLCNMDSDGWWHILSKDGGTHTLVVILKENEFFTEAKAETAITVRSANVIICDKDGVQKRVLPQLYTLERALALEPKTFGDFKLEEGDIFYIVPKGNVHLKNGEYTVKKGVALLLPYDKQDTDAFKAHRDDEELLFYPYMADNSAPVHAVELFDGAHIAVEGKILVGGVSSNRNGSSFQGATQGAFSQLTLHEGSSVTLAEGGELDVYGFVVGEGELIAESGSKLFAPIVIRDFRGGGNLMSTKSRGISPFNQFDMPNITAPQTIKCGACVYGHISLFAEGEHVDGDVTIISPNALDATLIRLFEGEIKIRNFGAYNAEAADGYAALAHKYVNTCEIELYGTAETGYIDFKGKDLVSFITNITPFAIPHGFDITVKSGSTLTVQNVFKLLPGATLKIEKGAEAIVRGTLAVYSADCWTDSARAGIHVYPSDFPDAVLEVDGKLSVIGKIGGSITSREEGAQVSLENGCDLSASVKEGSSSSASSLEYSVTVELAAKLAGLVGDVEHATYTFDGNGWGK